jgi:hypothetical protein
MKAILLKFWNFLKQKSNLLILIVILLILGLGIAVYFQHKQIIKLKNENEIQIHLKDALLDTMVIYQNKEKEWVAEKLTIQETTKNLEKMNGQLTDNQKELLARVEEIQKKNDIIAAALINTNVKVDSLLDAGKHTVVDTLKKTVNFSDSSHVGNKVILYNLTVGNILPAHIDVKPTLMINSLLFPNKQFVEFHWKDSKKQGYPVSFSISNSNDYFKTVNLDSYAIPGLVQPPSKIMAWLSKNGKTVIYIGAGIIVGGGAVYFLTK